MPASTRAKWTRVVQRESLTPATSTIKSADGAMRGGRSDEQRERSTTRTRMKPAVEQLFWRASVSKQIHDGSTVVGGAGFWRG